MGTLIGTTVPEYEVRYASNPQELLDALEIEDEVFREKNYLPVRTLYEPYLPQSTIMGAYALDGTCVGMTRIIDGVPFLPPILEPEHAVDIVERDYWVGLAKDGKMAEVATLAVPQQYRGSAVVHNLVRFAYRHSVGLTDYSGAIRPNGDRTHMAVILTPGVAVGFRCRYWYSFQQIGPKQHYMDGTEFREDAVTAPYVLDLHRFGEVTLASNPEYREWMMFAPMTDCEAPKIERLRRDSVLLKDLDLPLDLNEVHAGSPL